MLKYSRSKIPSFKAFITGAATDGLNAILPKFSDRQNLVNDIITSIYSEFEIRAVTEEANVYGNV